MKIAVTGASGHVGNVVCRKLIEKGYKVKAFLILTQEAFKILILN